MIGRQRSDLASKTKLLGQFLRQVGGDQLRPLSHQHGGQPDSDQKEAGIYAGMWLAKFWMAGRTPAKMLAGQGGTIPP